MRSLIGSDRARNTTLTRIGLSFASPLIVVGIANPQYTTRVSTTSGGVPLPNGATAWFNALSADGRWLVYNDVAGHLHDLRTGEDVIFGVSPYTDNIVRVREVSISADGNRLSFTSDSDELVLGDFNNDWDVFVYDRFLQTFHRASVPTGGGDAWGPSFRPVISADGSVVVFESEAPNLVPNDTNGHFDVFLHEIDSGVTEIVNVDSNGNMPTYPPGWCSGYCAWAGGSSVSGDGRFVAFGTLANNLANGADTLWWFDVFVRDRWTDTTTLISRGMAGAPADGDSFFPCISGDGRLVAFQSDAENMVPGDLGQSDIFVWDVVSGSLSLVTRGLGGVPADANSTYASMPYDGNAIGFYSIASNLVSNDTNNAGDAFVFDCGSSSIRIVSRSTTGQTGFQSGTSPISFSSDASRFTFVSAAPDIVAGDYWFSDDVFLRDERVQSQPLTSYCTAKTNSLGCVPRMTTSGIPSFTMPLAFFVVAHTERSHHSGVMFWSLAQANQPLHGGTLCVAPPFVRTPIQDSGGTFGADDCTGAYSFLFSPGYAAAHGLGPGDTFYAQCWSRDAGALVHTDALAVTLAP